MLPNQIEHQFGNEFRSFDETEYVYFLTKYDQFFKNNTRKSGVVNISIKKDLTANQPTIEN